MVSNFLALYFSHMRDAVVMQAGGYGFMGMAGFWQKVLFSGGDKNSDYIILDLEYAIISMSYEGIALLMW